jgi:hypothetical protein
MPFIKQVIDYLIQLMNQVVYWMKVFATDWNATWEIAKQGASAALMAIWDITKNVAWEMARLLVLPFKNLGNFLSGFISNLSEGVEVAYRRGMDQAWEGMKDHFSKSKIFELSEETKEAIETTKRMAKDLAEKSGLELETKAADVGKMIGGTAAAAMNEGILKGGMYDLLGLGRKTQEALLLDSTQTKIVSLLEKSVELQTEMVGQGKNPKQAAAVLG